MDTRNGYEDRLLEALREVVSEDARLESTTAAVRPARRYGPRAAVAAAATVFGIGAVVVLPMGGTPAFAVTPQADGRVGVEIAHLSDAVGLERKLADAGIPAHVTYLPTGMMCAEPRFTPIAGDSQEMVGFKGGSDGSLTFTLNRADFSAERSLVIVTSGPQDGPPTDGTEVLAVVAEGPVASCRAVANGDGAVPHP